MKTIGMLGGMSWESTRSYYNVMNSEVKQQLGGLHSAKIILNSVDFEPIGQYLQQSDWQNISKILCHEADKCAKANADCLIICTNTMHKLYDDINNSVTIPVLHIADALGQKLDSNHIKKVGLLGTKATLNEDFYHRRLHDNFAIESLIPDQEAIEFLNRLVFEELFLGIFNQESKNIFLDIIRDLQNKGAQAIALACTEFGLLVTQDDVALPIFDTAAIHAEYSINWALTQS